MPLMPEFFPSCRFARMSLSPRYTDETLINPTASGAAETLGSQVSLPVPLESACSQSCCQQYDRAGLVTLEVLHLGVFCC